MFVNETYFALTARYLQSSFLEIKQVKEYGFESLVGNVGGYVGMFLGYALLSFPEYLLKLHEYVKICFSGVKNPNIAS